MLQREGAGASARVSAPPLVATQAQVQLLEAKVAALEEENRTLRQRELMWKIFALGDRAAADQGGGATAKAAASSAGSGAASTPASPTRGPNGLPPGIEFTLLRGFTSRALVTFDPFCGFDMAQAGEGVATIEQEEAAARPRKQGAADQKLEPLKKRQSTLSRISSFMGLGSAGPKQIIPM